MWTQLLESRLRVVQHTHRLERVKVDMTRLLEIETASVQHADPETYASKPNETYDEQSHAGTHPTLRLLNLLKETNQEKQC